MIFGIPLAVVAVVAVYMAATVLTTEYLKKLLFFVDPHNSRHSFILSWAVGGFYFLLLWIMEVVTLNIVSLFVFCLVNGFLNICYKFTLLKQLLRKVMR